MSDTLQLAQELIARRSLTPHDEGCLTLVGVRLDTLSYALRDSTTNAICPDN